MSAKGWIKLHRSLIDHWVFDQEPLSPFGAWIDLLLRANYDANEVCVKNNLILIPRGSTITSMVKLSTRWKRGRKWVSRFLNNLEKAKMITQKRDNRFTLITICNYSKFQSEIEELGQQREQQREQRWDSRGNTIKKERKKELKKELKRKISKENFSQNLKDLNFDSWPIQPNEEQKEIWHENRQRKKLPITQSIVDRHGRRFQDCVTKGYKVRECMEMFLDNAWHSPELRYFENCPNLKMAKRTSDKRNEFRKAKPYRRQPPSEKALDSIKSMKNLLPGMRKKN
jgi:hypothetical protein